MEAMCACGRHAPSKELYAYICKRYPNKPGFKSLADLVQIRRRMDPHFVDDMAATKQEYVAALKRLRAEMESMYMALSNLEQQIEDD
jgi:phage host-nuclease inhibitor protein Gam